MSPFAPHFPRTTLCTACWRLAAFSTLPPLQIESPLSGPSLFPPPVLKASAIPQGGAFSGHPLAPASSLHFRPSAVSAHRRTDFLEALRQVSLELTAELDLNSLLRSIVSRAVILLQGTAGMLFLHRPERDELELVMAAPSHPGAQFGGTLRRGQALAGQVWEAGRPIVLAHPFEEGEQRDLFTSFQIFAAVGAPIWWGEEFLGVVTVHRARPRLFEEQELELLVQFATQAAIAIRNAHVMLEQTRQRERADALARIALRLNAQLSLPEVFHTLCEETLRALHVQAATIRLYNVELDALVHHYGLGQQAGDDLLMAPIPLTLFREHITENSIGAAVIRDFPPPPGFDPANLPTLKSLAFAWMVFEGRLVGTLNALAVQEARTFQQDELDFLTALAHQGAAAITTAILFAGWKQRARELEGLSEVSSELRRANSVQEMLTIFAAQSRQVLKAEEVSLMFQSSTGLEVIRAYPPPDSILQEQHPPLADPPWNHLPAGVIFSTASPEVTALLPFHDATALQTAWAATALRIDDSFRGLLRIAYARPHIFSQDEERLILALANLASNALQRAGVMQTLERRVADRTRELNTLYQVASIANASSDLQHGLEQSFQVVLQAVNACSGLIHLRFESSPKVLSLMVSCGLEADFLRDLRSIPIGMGLIGEAASKEEMIVLKDAGAEPLSEFPIYASFRPDLFAAIPIRAKESLVGVMSIFAPGKPEFTPEDLALLNTVADQYGFMIENASLHREAERSAAIAERQRLARELHDSVTQTLYSLSLFARAGINLTLQKDQNAVESYFKTIERNSLLALKEMRLLIYELRPSVLQEEGLVSAVQQRLDAVEGRTGIHATLEVEGELDLSPQIEAELYWIIQEALNNALKHSFAEAVAVRLQVLSGLGVLEVSDNGKGFVDRLTSERGGFGLNSMRQRAKNIGARLKVLSSPDEGTRVVVEFAAHE